MFHGATGDGASHPVSAYTPLADRLPPQNLECEAGVLGGMLLDNAVIAEVAAFLKAEDFYRDAHQAVYRAVLELWAGGGPVDGLTLADRLTLSGRYEELGGDDLLAALIGSVPHAVNAVYYAQIVRQKSIGRQLIEVANETLREGYSNSFTAEQLLESAERRVFAVGEQGARGEARPASDIVPGVMDRITRRRVDGEVTGISCGITDVDDVTCGFQPGNLIYLAARTSMGKTSLALNIADHAAVNQGLPVLLFSMEMSEAEVVERMVVSRSCVDGYKVRTGQNVRPGEAARLAEAAALIAAAPLWVDDTESLTVAQVAARARRAKSRHGLGLLVLDYVQLLDGDDHRDSRREQMSKASRRLKGLARELDVPVLALAQLNRGPENREGNRPRKSDLKETGSLEEDADLVLLLYRPDYYDPNDSPGQAVVIVDKNRNGPTADVRVVFAKNIMRFDNLSRAAEPPIDPGNH